MKKTALFILLCSLSIFSASPALAQSQYDNSIASPGIVNENSATAGRKEANLYFFWGEGCPHCLHEKPFLEKMEAKYPELTVHSYEIWKNAENRKLMAGMGQILQAQVSGVPFTIIGDQYVVGWLDENSSGAQIERAIKCVIEDGCRDFADVLKENGFGEEKVAAPSQIPESLTLPLFGEIKTRDFSLPVLTIIIAALDGFNPCAMWTLIFLIGLLLGMKNRLRMWILGSAFIVASAGVYFLFLSAWLNLLLFIGFILWVRLGIGLVALGGGSYYLREFFVNPDSTCVVGKSEKRKKVFEKLRKLTHEKNFFLALLGIILLAVAVNMVELICSAGLPAVYTQILALSDLPTWQYYLYLLLYILVFMLDDLLIFVTAMLTLQVTGLSSKYARISHLIGGLAMVIIGLLLIFKPEWLMFG